jgi:hypothetical protein
MTVKNVEKYYSQKSLKKSLYSIVILLIILISILSWLLYHMRARTRFKRGLIVLAAGSRTGPAAVPGLLSCRAMWVIPTW